MIYKPTPLPGSYLVCLEPRTDERGMFARAFCAREFAENGLEFNFVQANISVNNHIGTVRGMHFQYPPHDEVKLVRCIKGSIYDIIVDLRQESPAYLQWFGAELSDGNGHMMYVPKGFAHGYQALCDGATAHYMVSAYYEPASEGGCRYDDPTFGISWPMPITNISDKDSAWPLIMKPKEIKKTNE